MKNKTMYKKTIGFGIMIVFIALSVIPLTGGSKLVQPAENASGLSVVDPNLSFVTLTNTAYNGFTTCPRGDAYPYMYVLVTVKNVQGNPMVGLPATNFQWIIGTLPGTVWSGTTLTLVFNPVDAQTNSNGQIRFTITTSNAIIGNITIKSTVNGIILNDLDALPCKSYDYNHDGGVAIHDLIYFGDDFKGGINSYRSDFNWDGIVNIGDLTMFADHFIHPGLP